MRKSLQQKRFCDDGYFGPRMGIGYRQGRPAEFVEDVISHARGVLGIGSPHMQHEPDAMQKVMEGTHEDVRFDTRVRHWLQAVCPEWTEKHTDAILSELDSILEDGSMASEYWCSELLRFCKQRPQQRNSMMHEEADGEL